MEVKILVVVLSSILCFSNAQRFKTYGSVVLGKYAPPNATFTKTYYLSIALKSDWMSAASFCINNGLTLVTLDSPDEIQNFLVVCNSNSNLFASNTWNVGIVGAASSNPTDKTAWVWFSTGQAMSTPIRWEPGEPNNNAGTMENCLSVQYGSDGQFGFNDIPCSFLHVQGQVSQFVCQESTLEGKGNVPAASG